MRGRLPLALLLSLMSVAGCLGAAQTPAPEAAPQAPPAHDAPVHPLVATPLAQAAVSHGNEPMILVGPTGTLWIGDTSGAYRSTDAGATWRALSDPFVEGLFTDGRALALDADNTLYMGTTNGQLIEVAASHDGGSSWPTVDKVVDAASIADRPWVAARGHGEVSVVDNADTGERCMRSTDGGSTFLDRSILTTGNPNPGNLVYDASGTLYFTNGAAVERWLNPCKGTLVQTVSLPASGAQIFAMVALDASGHNYVPLPTPGNGAIQLVGHNQMSPLSQKTLVVSPPELHSNSFATVAERNGEIAVAWLGTTSSGDPSASGFQGTWNIYVARVAGFWTATPTVTVTQVTTTGMHDGWFCMGGVSCTSGRNLGDYIGLAYGASGDLHLAYVDDKHDGAVHYAHVA